MNQPVLYLMFGYPGAGKTTVAKMIEAATGATRLSSDEVRLQLFKTPTFSAKEHSELYTYLDEKCRKLLESGRSVIYDANLNRLQHRQEKYAIAREKNTQVRLVWVKTARELAKQRATDANRPHFIPPTETATSLFERVANVLEPPTVGEKPVIIDGQNVTEEDIKRITQS